VFAVWIDNFTDCRRLGSTSAGVATVNTDADHDEYGRIDFRPTRHSLTGIPGANGKAHLSQKACCGLLESNYYLPLRAPIDR
jgi:hypothetical protein